MSDHIHVLLDKTAMLAAGQGNAFVSKLIHRAHSEAGWYLYATTCALVEADRLRPGTAEHLASLPGITILDLDLPAALAISPESTWAIAHTRHAAEPSPERPDGAFIATATPDQWADHPVRVLDIRP
ncbi:hypothetical protein [Streptomyces sp. UNOC14_S4]|uniref:hypothetical protein n=1 Tax=Streptomyces sp. UNOC14_S4 TaxID=2872340 RepID=UPI001E4BB401|nr:hypothetical protein [Streptomyces sp. UNOC14_S4]MCC3769438.1 hypothetical protein [Streptomyces sp. UNOC14_S4]